MIFAFYFLAAFGLAYIIGHSKISLPFRQALDPGPKIESQGDVFRSWLLILLECPACLGFWIGLAAALYQFPLPLALSDWEFAVLLPLVTCSSNFILGRVTGLISEE